MNKLLATVNLRICIHSVVNSLKYFTYTYRCVVIDEVSMCLVNTIKNCKLWHYLLAHERNHDGPQPVNTDL